jgi:hypothetical protein
VVSSSPRFSGKARLATYSLVVGQAAVARGLAFVFAAALSVVVSAQLAALRSVVSDNKAHLPRRKGGGCSGDGSAAEKEKSRSEAHYDWI